MAFTLLDTYPSAGNFAPLLLVLLLAVVAIAGTLFLLRYLQSRRQ